MEVEGRAQNSRRGHSRDVPRPETAATSKGCCAACRACMPAYRRMAFPCSKCKRAVRRVGGNDAA